MLADAVPEHVRLSTGTGVIAFSRSVTAGPLREGPLADAGVSLHALFGFAAITAVISGRLSLAIARESPATAVAPSPRQEEQQA